MDRPPTSAESRPAARRGTPILRRAGPQTLLLLALCAFIYWTNLGASGFSSTEGHRAIPAWELLGRDLHARTDVFITTLFERPYLRKPPGMPWAIALSSAVFGQTEFAARAVSAAAATLATLTMLAFGRRWFGPVGGFAAGLAQALTPRWWAPGRSAEIEMLNNFGTLLALAALADLLVLRHRHHARSSLLAAGLAAMGIVVAGLAKGPASLPVLLGLFAGAFLISRSPRSLLRAPILAALVVGITAVAIVFLTIVSRSRTLPEPAVVQSVTEFLWKPEQFWNVLAMPIVALVSALPASLALLFPWGPDARDESTPDRPRAHVDAHRIAMLMTWTCLLGLTVFLAVGVNNPRYAMPALTPIAAVVGYVAYGASGWFIPLRDSIAVWMNLGGRWGWPAVLIVAAAYYVSTSEPKREWSSGRSAGVTLAASLPDRCELWADGLVEARPEVIRAATDTARTQGRSVRARWIPLSAEPDWTKADPAARVFVLLRDDELGDEWSQAQRAGWSMHLAPVTTGTAHKYSYRLFEYHPRNKAAE